MRADPVQHRQGSRDGAARDLATELAALPGLSLDELKERWRYIYKVPPPYRLGRSLLIRAISYSLQARYYGDLRSASRRRLKRLAEEVGSGQEIAAGPMTSLRPGTRLVREWRGESHVVEVLADGFIWRDASYLSLSAVARAITGARWSGPRFFGLRDRQRAADADGVAPGRGKSK